MWNIQWKIMSVKICTIVKHENKMHKILLSVAFELWYWRRLMRVPWTARRSNQSILKEINPKYSLEGLMLKRQYFGHMMWRIDSSEKTLMLGKDWRQKKGMTEDEMVGWHHWLNEYEFEQAPGGGEGQGSLACCCPWGRKESDMTKQLNNNCWVKQNIMAHMYEVPELWKKYL